MLAGRMLFRYQILCFIDAERDAFRNSPIFLSCFLDIGLPDLGGHPGWLSLRIFYLFPLSGKYMHLFVSSFT
jgi:hypothetical protein